MKAKGTHSLYSHVDPIRFLNDAYEAIRTERPDFSVRAWARAIGLRQSATLSQILNGDRGVPVRLVPGLSRSLGLRPAERRYFEALLGLSRARTAAEQERWMTRARAIYESVAIELEAIEDLKLLDHPVLSALLGLVERPDFRYDTRWIQRRLQLSVDAKTLRESFDYLLARGFLALDASGRMCRIRQTMWAKQKRFSQLFTESLTRQPA